MVALDATRDSCQMAHTRFRIASRRDSRTVVCVYALCVAQNATHKRTAPEGAVKLDGKFLFRPLARAAEMGAHLLPFPVSAPKILSNVDSSLRHSGAALHCRISGLNGQEEACRSVLALFDLSVRGVVPFEFWYWPLSTPPFAEWSLLN